MGIELKRGLTPKGLRQAEVEYYLWAGCSMFPFVQIITDMQVGGAAFFRTGSSRAGLASQSIGRRMSACSLYHCARDSTTSEQQIKMWYARVNLSDVVLRIFDKASVTYVVCPPHMQMHQAVYANCKADVVAMVAGG